MCARTSSNVAMASFSVTLDAGGPHPHILAVSLPLSCPRDLPLARFLFRSSPRGLSPSAGMAADAALSVCTPFHLRNEGVVNERVVSLMSKGLGEGVEGRGRFARRLAMRFVRARVRGSFRTEKADYQATSRWEEQDPKPPAFQEHAVERHGCHCSRGQLPQSKSKQGIKTRLKRDLLVGWRGWTTKRLELDRIVIGKD